MEFPEFQFVPIVSGSHRKESGFSIFVHLAIRCILLRSPWSLVSSRLNSPGPFSLSSHVRCSKPLIVVVALCCTLSSKSTSVLYWGAQHRIQHSRCVSPGRSRGEGPSPSTCRRFSASGSPGGCRPLLQGLINLVSTGTLRASSAKLLPSRLAPACPGAWGCSSPGTGLGISIC